MCVRVFFLCNLAICLVLWALIESRPVAAWVTLSGLPTVLANDHFAAEEFPITTSAVHEWNPAVSDNLVVWSDTQGIHGFDLTTRVQFPLVSLAPEHYVSLLALDKHTLVWVEIDNTAQQPDLYDEVYVLDLTTGTKELLFKPYRYHIKTIDISGDFLVWERDWGIGREIVVHNLTTHESSIIKQGGVCGRCPKYSPSISGDTVVFRYHNNDLGIYDLKTATEFIHVPVQKCPSLSNGPPDIDGNIIVWSDTRRCTFDIYGYDLTTGTEFVISAHDSEQGSARISNSIVVWIDNGDGFVHGKDLISSIALTVSSSSPGGVSPPEWPVEISGNTVVWVNRRDGNDDIYGALLTGIAPVTTYDVLHNGAYSSAWSAFVSDPVNAVFGNYVYQFTDLAIPGLGPDLVFARTYNSANPSDGALGYGWTHSLIATLIQETSNSVLVKNIDSRLDRFTNTGSNTYAAPPGVFNRLTKNPDNSFSLTHKDQTIHHFDSAGRLTTITDKNNNSLSLTYTGEDLTAITDAAGRTTTLTYDAQHRIVQITDPAGRTVRYAYDQAGNLVDVTDARGFITRYSYDTEHRLLSITDANGHTFVTNTYDSNGRVIQQQDALSNTTTFNYDLVARQTTVTDPLGRQTIYTYDANWRVVGMTDAMGNTESYSYDTSNNRITVADKRGNVTHYAYDSHGNTTGITDALGFLTTMTYDAQHNLTSIIDALGRTTTLAYDSHSNLTAVTDPLGNTTTYTYDTKGMLIQVRDANTSEIRFSYDPFGYQTAIIDALDNTATFTYDIIGRRLSETDARGHTTTYTYDPHNHLLTMTDPLGGVTTYEYDDVGNRVGSTDALGRQTTYTYEGKDRLVAITNPAGGVTTYGYDAVDNRINTTDANSHTTTYSYDTLDRLIAITTPLGNTTSFEYDANGNRLKFVDANSREVRYMYDALNRLEQVTDPLGNTTRYTYDAVGNKTATTDANGNTTFYSYDALNRLSNVTDALGGIVTYAYDAVGNRLSMTDANGHITIYTYDPLGRLATVTDPVSNSTAYTYDRAGNRQSLTDGNGHTTTYTYDALNRLTRVSYSTHQIEYTYNAVSNRLSMSDQTGITSYTYDNLDRLIQVTDGAGKTIGYTYDAVGNRAGITYPGGDTVHYTYDADDRMETVTDWAGRTTTYSYDAAGHLLNQANPNGTRSDYTYDPANRLIELANSGPEGIISKYTYTLDNVGNRLRVVEESAPVIPVTSQPIAFEQTVHGQLNSTNASLSYSFAAAAGQWASVRMFSDDGTRNARLRLYGPDGTIIVTNEALLGANPYSFFSVLLAQSGIYRLEVTHSGDTQGDIRLRLEEGHQAAVGDINRDCRVDNADYTLMQGQWGTDDQNADLDLSGLVNSFDYSILINNWGRTCDAAINTPTPSAPTATATHTPVDVTTATPTATTSAGSPSVPSPNLTPTSTTSIGLTPIPTPTSQAVGTPAPTPVPTATTALPPGGTSSYHVFLPSVSQDTVDTDSSSQLGEAAADVDNRGQAAAVEGINETVVTTTTYTYDALYRLISVTYPNGESVTYAYDAMGNRVQIHSSAGTLTYTYDAADRLLSISDGTTFTWDNNGNQSSKEGTNYAYNAVNRLTQVTSETATVQLSYDGDGNRTSKTTDGLTTIYTYDINGMLPVILLEKSTTGDTRYVYGLDLITRVPSNNNINYYHYDGLGSSRQLTDSSGKITAYYEYSVFGSVRTRIDSTDNIFMYTGEQLDNDTGLLYLRVRHYDPENGRFTTRDLHPGYSTNPQSLNRYLYVQNNPILFTDPSGLSSKDTASLTSSSHNLQHSHRKALLEISHYLEFFNFFYTDILAKELLYKLALNRPIDTSIQPYLHGRGALRAIGKLGIWAQLTFNTFDSMQRLYGEKEGLYRGEIASYEVLAGEVFAVSANTLNDIFTGPGRAFAKLLFGQELVNVTPIVAQLDQRITGRQVIDNIEAFQAFGFRRYFGCAWVTIQGSACH